MPSGPIELHRKWGDDGTAWEALKANYKEHRGIIYPKVAGYEPTDEEDSAIRYMIMEWDYGYANERPSFPDEEQSDKSET